MFFSCFVSYILIVYMSSSYEKIISNPYKNARKICYFKMKNAIYFIMFYVLKWLKNIFYVIGFKSGIEGERTSALEFAVK